MVRMRSFAFIVIGLCFAAFVWYGCSDNTVRTIVSADDQAESGSDSYFLPLEQGFGIIYDITYANGSGKMVTLEIGKPVQMAGFTVYEWFSDDGDTRDTGYIAAGVAAAYFYDALNGSPEKMLEFPLVAGDSWERFSDEYGGDDWVDILTGYDDGETDDAVASKVLPSEGGNIMTVVGYEDVALSNGSSFNGAVKIRNESSASGKVNYYWYVANIGLVKYMLGTTDRNNATADVVGELISFGK